MRTAAAVTSILLIGLHARAQPCAPPRAISPSSTEKRPDRGCAEVETFESEDGNGKTPFLRDAPPRAAARRRACGQLARGPGLFVAKPSRLRRGPVGNNPYPRDPAEQANRVEDGHLEVVYDRIDFVGCNAHFPVYTGLPVTAFDVVDGGKRLLILSGHGLHEGDIADTLDDVRVVLVDLATLRATSFEVTSFIGSIAAVTEPGGTVLVRTRRSQGGARETNEYARCTPGRDRCDPVEKATFPSSGYLEATAAGGYRVGAIPSNATLRANTLRRSVRLSPDGKRLAWVIDEPQKSGLSKRTLLVGALDGGAAKKIADGFGDLVPHWLDDDHLLYDGDPVSTAAYAKLDQELRASGWTANMDERVRNDLDKPDEKEARRKLRSLVDGEIVRRAIAAGGVGGLLALREERIFMHELSSGRARPFLDEAHVRLFGQRAREDGHLESPPADGVGAPGAVCHGAGQCAGGAICCATCERPGCASQCVPPCKRGSIGCVQGCLLASLARPEPPISAEQHAREAAQRLAARTPAHEFFRDAACGATLRADPACDGPPADATARARCGALTRGRGLFVLGASDPSRGGVATGGMQQLRMSLARGRTSQGPATVATDRIEFVGCGVRVPVLAGLPVSAFEVFGRRLVAIHVLERSYQGASRPYLFTARLSVVDLDSLAVTTVALDSAASVSVAPDAGGLLVLLRDDDRERLLRCDAAGRCAPSPAGTRFPSGGYLEATGAAGYRVEERTGSAPPSALRRSLRKSPGGRHLAYVTQTLEEPAPRDYRVRRTLFVQPLPSGAPIKVAEGASDFHTRWLDDKRLLVDDEPRPSELFAEQLAWLRSHGEIERIKTGILDRGGRIDDASPLAVTLELEQRALESIVKATGSIGAAQREGVLVYDLATRKLAPFLPDDHARLLGETRSANVRGGSAGVVEVPPRP